MARAARLTIGVGVLAGMLAWGCGAKAPPRPPTEATTTRIPMPKKVEPGAGGTGGAAEQGGTGGAGGIDPFDELEGFGGDETFGDEVPGSE